MATLPQHLQNLKIARVSTIEQMQTIVALDQAFAYYPNGLYQLALNKNDDLTYLPIEDNPSNQIFKIKAIYPKNSPKIKEINTFIQFVGENYSTEN